MADVMPSRSKARLIGKVLWVTAGSAILTFVVVIVVLVTLFGVSLPVQHSIQRATSPQSQQAASGATAAAESHIITCEENHMNRLFERALHMRIDPTDGGCPADSLP